MNKQDILNILNKELLGKEVDTQSQYDIMRALKESVLQTLVKYKDGDKIRLSVDKVGNEQRVEFYIHFNEDKGFSSYNLFNVVYNKKRQDKYSDKFCYSRFDSNVMCPNYGANENTIEQAFALILQFRKSNEAIKTFKRVANANMLKKIMSDFNLSYNKCLDKLESIVKMRYSEDFKKLFESGEE